MAEIIPNSDFLILQNVPLESDYTNTLYWSDVSSQVAYFQSKVKWNLTAQQYQRHSTGVMRVGIKADSLINCNYMMFRNTAFGSKWFYAFIDDVEYVNNEVSRLYYTIDVMQTWCCDITFNECIVERETPASDELFENLVPENLAIGEYVQQGNFDTVNLLEHGQKLAIFYSYNQPPSGEIPSFPIYNGKIINGVFMGLNYSIIDLNTSSINSLLKSLTETQSVIAGAVQIPADLVSSGNLDFKNYSMIVDVEQPFTFRAYDNNEMYTPKNKKLFSYPYMYLLLTNNCGSSSEYHWEDFEQSLLHYAEFKINGAMTSQPEYIAYPTNYKGITDAYEYGIVYNDFVNCPYSQDSFTAWWNINKEAFITSIATSVFKNAAHGATTVALGGGALAGAGAVANTVDNLIGKYTEYKSHALSPDNIAQFSAVPGLRMSQNRCAFNWYTMAIKPEQARVIDDFFTRYGYAQNKLKRPDRHNPRTPYHYVKTFNCSVNGLVPAVYEKQICQIMDNGVTWWNSPSSVGNYN